MTEDDYLKGRIYPPFTNIRKISAHIAAEVAAKAYELGEFSKFYKWFDKLLHTKFKLADYESFNLHHPHFSGLATRLPRPSDLVKYAESCMYTPLYRSYR